MAFQTGTLHKCTHVELGTRATNCIRAARSGTVHILVPGQDNRILATKAAGACTSVRTDPVQRILVHVVPRRGGTVYPNLSRGLLRPQERCIL